MSACPSYPPAPLPAMPPPPPSGERVVAMPRSHPKSIRAQTRWSQDSRNVRHFINALRNFLDLDPLYDRSRPQKRKGRDE